MEEREAEGFDEEAAKKHIQKTETEKHHAGHTFSGCPSSRIMEFKKPENDDGHQHEKKSSPSQLTQWPVKIALVPPGAPFLENADLLLAADCVPFSYSDFHGDFLKDKAVLIGCPKLDDPEFYLERITEILKSSDIRSLTVAHMEVPCCHALYHIAEQAVRASDKDISLRKRVVGIRGEEKKTVRETVCDHEH